MAWIAAVDAPGQRASRVIDEEDLFDLIAHLSPEECFLVTLLFRHGAHPLLVAFAHLYIVDDTLPLDDLGAECWRWCFLVQAGLATHPQDQMLRWVRDLAEPEWVAAAHRRLVRDTRKAIRRVQTALGLKPRRVPLELFDIAPRMTPAERALRGV